MDGCGAMLVARKRGTVWRFGTPSTTPTRPLYTTTTPLPFRHASRACSEERSRPTPFGWTWRLCHRSLYSMTASKGCGALPDRRAPRLQTRLPKISALGYHEYIQSVQGRLRPYDMLCRPALTALGCCGSHCELALPPGSARIVSPPHTCLY